MRATKVTESLCGLSLPTDTPMREERRGQSKLQQRDACFVLTLFMDGLSRRNAILSNKNLHSHSSPMVKKKIGHWELPWSNSCWVKEMSQVARIYVRTNRSRKKLWDTKKYPQGKKIQCGVNKPFSNCFGYVVLVTLTFKKKSPRPLHKGGRELR